MDPLVVLSNLDKLVKFLNTKYKYTYFPRWCINN